MSWFEALVLGLIQGLTEYLPVSSSGHLAIGQALFGMEDGEENLMFTVAVHVATVLSTLVILWKEVNWMLRGLGSFSVHLVRGDANLEKNAGMRYALNIIVSMIPVGIVGLFFKDEVEAVFGSGLLVVGCCLLITAVLLIFSYYAKPRQKETISWKDALVIGIAQAIAVLPGVSRSGSTIATGLLLGNKKELLAQFSFLMVIPPILGEALLDILKMIKGENVMGSIETLPLIIGFVAAFLSGCLACKWMINIVKKGKLIYFGIYCAIIGILLLAYSV
ncbi:MAG: undecaprenyl-diphosphate phosphatase [Prevotella sp.]|nr:undecaprenyl-diphosphate phosphatase [Prevotella sp.]